MVILQFVLLMLPDFALIFVFSNLLMGGLVMVKGRESDGHFMPVTLSFAACNADTDKFFAFIADGRAKLNEVMDEADAEGYSVALLRQLCLPTLLFLPHTSFVRLPCFGGLSGLGGLSGFGEGTVFIGIILSLSVPKFGILPFFISKQPIMAAPLD